MVGRGPAEGADGAIPVVPVADTLKRRTSGGLVTATVDRDGLVAVQTPQAFTAVGPAPRPRGRGPRPPTTPGSWRGWALTVRTVAGDPRNLKLTRPEDLALAEALMAGAGGEHERTGPGRRSGSARASTSTGSPTGPDRPLVLGGVTITGDGARGLDGHSDADAVAHAIADAVLGAAGLGDLGRHAPDTDPAWQRRRQHGDPGPDGGPGRRRRLGRR